MNIKMILLDLDGTLLDRDKKISPENYAALEQAAQNGALIVPCTGRFYGAMPEEIRGLPFVRYVITINGAEIFDTQTDTCLHREDISVERALELFDFMDDLPVIYDCFQDGWGWMDEKFYGVIDDYIDDPHINIMAKTKRTPVENFKKIIRERGRPIQKTQMFFGDLEARARYLKTLPQQLSDLSVTSSLTMNIELNSKHAHKGRALEVLCEILDIPVGQTMAFGDGSNDTSMILSAGIGVAMENAILELKGVADYVTCSNDKNGVAAALRHFGVI